MPRTQDRLVMKWMIVFASFAVFLVVYGGFVRLSRSGLSIVEWQPIEGAVPPLTIQDWQTEFAKYQTTPEYQQVNRGITIQQYQKIFLIEWLHRLVARLAGLVFAVPLLIFLLSRRIPWRESAVYLLMGLLFGLQAVMGWVMVSSGLVDRPSVSHYFLAAHLLLALALIGISVWTLLGHLYGFPAPQGRVPLSSASRLTLMTLLVLLIQISYGAFTAGLRAGHVSNSWPLMLGRWIPFGLFRQLDPPLLGLVSAPVTVAFIHRWLAIVAFLGCIIAYAILGRTQIALDLRGSVRLACGLGVLQIGLGIAVVVSGVDTALALLHQLNAISLFVSAVHLLHRLRTWDTFRAAQSTAAP